MTPTQGSTRYSSAGNSGYDDDFEADADELDGDLDFGGQASDDDAGAVDAIDASTHGGEAYGSNDIDLESDANQQDSALPQMQSHSPGDEELQHEKSLILNDHPPFPQRLGTAQRTERAVSPPTPTHGSLDLPPHTNLAPGSPDSPQHTLPPLSLTASPYLQRASAPAHPADPPAPTAPLPAPTSTAFSQPTQPSVRLPPAYPAPGGASPSPAARHGTSRAGSVGSTSKRLNTSLDASTTTTTTATSTAVSALALALLQQAGSQGAETQQQQLAAAISQSVDVLRASEHIRQLQVALEVLTGQVMAAERGRSAAEGALVELTQRMQEQETRLNEACETKLLDKQREIQQLRTKVQQLEAQGVKGRLAAHPRASHQGVASGASASISPDEAATLRRELEQTELLIRGYQHENEAATRRIKELEESLAASESRIAEEVLRSERAVLLAREDVRRRNVETASKLARVLALEKELAGVREEAQTREMELRSQLERLRAEKKALEARAGGVDCKAMAEGDVLVRQLREEMDSSRQATQALVQEMQSKLTWYAENQELLNKNDALVAQQRDTIQQLQARLVQHEGKGASSAGRGVAAQARIRELEAQVKQLNKALQSRAPGNSLAAVVAAARPSPEETQLVSELREQVDDLEAQLRRKDEEFEMQLRTYQQQFEKLKSQYTERASRLEAVGKAKGRVKELEKQLEDVKTAFRRRERELESRLKVALDHGAVVPTTPTLAPVASAPQHPASSLNTPTHGQQQSQSQHPLPQQGPGSATARRDDLVPASQLRAREQEVKKLTADLERRSKQVSELHLKLGEAESRILRLTADLRRLQQSGLAGQSPMASRAPRNDSVLHDDRPVGPSQRDARQQLELYPYADGAEADGKGERRASMALLERLEGRCSNLTVENTNLRGQVQALSQQLSVMRRDLEEAHSAAAAQSTASASTATSMAEVDGLRRKVEAAEMALQTVQRSATEAVERGALAASEHQRAMLRLHDEVSYKEGLKWQGRLATMEQELRVSQNRCDQLEAELAVARSRGVGAWSPEASAFAALERRLDEMARDIAAREAKWRAVLQDTQSMHGVEADAQRRKWESLLTAKEAEVQATRAELKSLLQEVAQVQELQTRLVAKQQRLAVPS